MVSLKECRKILTQNGQEYSKEEIENIRDALQEMVDIEFKHYLKTKYYE